jgi:hypothetical protein
LRKKNLFLSSFPFDFVNRVFCCFSARGAQKRTYFLFSKVRLENLKNTQEKLGR